MLTEVLLQFTFIKIKNKKWGIKRLTIQGIRHRHFDLFDDEITREELKHTWGLHLKGLSMEEGGKSNDSHPLFRISF